MECGTQIEARGSPAELRDVAGLVEALVVELERIPGGFFVRSGEAGVRGLKVGIVWMKYPAVPGSSGMGKTRLFGRFG